MAAPRRAVAAALAVTSLVGCTARGVEPVRAQLPRTTAAPEATPIAASPVGAPFEGQTLMYAAHGFTSTELTALRRLVAEPVTAVVVREREVRSIGGRTVPVTLAYGDADSY